MLKVTYIQHSCFLVELDRTVLLFDYFNAQDTMSEVGYEGVLPPFPRGKKIYVFASHCHRDHFSLEVLRWEEYGLDVFYVLSKDIRLGRAYLARNGIDPAVREKIRFVTPVGKYQAGDLKIETLRSNDAGVAFLVEAEGRTIYHAGDLHWWNAGQRQELTGEIYGNAYKREMRRLLNRHIDVAFVVLDPRMKDTFYLGMEYFLEHVDADVIFPMHLWRQYDLIPKFKRRPQTAKLADKVVEIDRENMVFQIGGENE